MVWLFQMSFLAWRCLPESFLQEMPLAVVRDIMQFGQLLPTLFCSVLASTTSVQRTTFLSQHFSREFFGWKRREYGRNREKYGRLGKWQGEGHVECNFVGFPQGRNYSRGIGGAWHPSKPKVGSCHNHHTSPETGKNRQKPILSGYVKICAQLCQEGNLVRPLVHSGSQLLTSR